MPWWAAAALAVAVYLIRSALRGWDLRPDPIDAVIFGGLGLIVIARALLRSETDGDDDPGA